MSRPVKREASKGADYKTSGEALREAIAEYDRGQGQAPMLAKIGLALSCRRYLPPILDRLEELENLWENLQRVHENDRGVAYGDLDALLSQPSLGKSAIERSHLQGRNDAACENGPSRELLDALQARVLADGVIGRVRSYCEARMKENSNGDYTDGVIALARSVHGMLPPAPTKGGDNG